MFLLSVYVVVNGDNLIKMNLFLVLELPEEDPK
jgi:hypothetical protein